ncbi:hypothetical protein [Herbidospora daliensis]|uniref:hypothetical protein n=1 Tax=Herbidospora daliensis TaxID=295585 RepID=UPI000781C8F5|nr:hypothetical protein [Herbidospora daliensis]
MTPDISACTLPTAERPLRVAEFDTLFAEAVRGVRRESPERLRFELAHEPGYAARAAHLAVREHGCCSFFTFTLTVADGGLTLDATVPPGHEDVLDAIEARAAGR